MRTLIYKRTHNVDPDDAGVFGCRDCMGRVRGWAFEAVIGVGGNGGEAQRSGIAEKLTWIGIGPHKSYSGELNGPLVTFDRFLLLGAQGPALGSLAPNLAARIYGRNVRVIMGGMNDEERREAQSILSLAARAPPSRALVAARGTPALGLSRTRALACRPRTRSASGSGSASGPA
jgi:hypothetical protein